MNPHLDRLVQEVSQFPTSPGVYQYYDEKKMILYVGKAKNLKKRVSSYFNKEQVSSKVTVLVKKIVYIEYIVVATEFDALLLENNLIKKYQPRYNIQLKDDKTFPWICVKNEAFPRVFSTRHVVKDKSDYFGPYASVRMMHTLLDLVKQLFPIRTCKLSLSADHIKKRSYKKCLEYHIGNCKAPCEQLQSEADYLVDIQQIKFILKGNISVVVKQLHEVMMGYAQAYAFEKAQQIKEKIELLEKYQGKSIIVHPTIDNVDVFSLQVEEQVAYANYLKIIKGAIVQSHTIEIKKKLDETPQELLSYVIADFRLRFDSSSSEVIVPFMPDIESTLFSLHVPQKGDKKSLLDLSERNVRYYKLEKDKQLSLVDPERHVNRVMEQMQKDLRLPEKPVYIECFDNSNIQGAYPVSAMVVFRNGKPAKKEYRHFNIKSVEGPNDFASMEEVIYRRYHRLVEEKLPLPQLIVVDGGKGQLSSALKSLEKLGLRGVISSIGIAKKLEEIYYPGDSIPMYLDKKSESLKIIQQLRDEAHRFGITHHRKRRDKGTIQTELTKIKGIGEGLANQLLVSFKSVQGIKNASLEEVQQVIGKAKATLVFGYFHP